jgi:hypothetical protein
MSTSSFSLLPRQIEAIRASAQREGVSQSEIVRRAIDLALIEASPPPGSPTGPPGPGRRGHTVLAPIVKELATIRRELGMLRETLARLDVNATGPPDWQPGPRVETDVLESAVASW